MTGWATTCSSSGWATTCSSWIGFFAAGYLFRKWLRARREAQDSIRSLLGVLREHIAEHAVSIDPEGETVESFDASDVAE